MAAFLPLGMGMALPRTATRRELHGCGARPRVLPNATSSPKYRRQTGVKGVSWDHLQGHLSSKSSDAWRPQGALMGLLLIYNVTYGPPVLQCYRTLLCYNVTFP